MKPALSPQTTGFLPTLRTSALTSSRTCGSVTTVRTISTRSWTGAGLKKCTPTMRPGCALAVEISVTLRLEVLVARIASGATTPSSSRKIAFLTSTDSTTASTTKSASCRSLSAVLKLIRPSSSACSASVSFSRRTARAVEFSRCWRPRATPSSFSSTPITENPLRANTSAIPAPMVPSPTTPMVLNSRDSWACSVMSRTLVDSRVTIHLSAMLITHRGAVDVQPEVALLLPQPPLVRRLVGLGDLREAQARVVGAVPRHVAVGAEAEPVVAVAARLGHRRLDQRPPDPPALVVGQHRDLLEVGVAVELEDVREADRRALRVGGRHQQEARLRRPPLAGARRRQQDRLDRRRRSARRTAGRRRPRSARRGAGRRPGPGGPPR